MGSSQSSISQPDQLPISPVILKLRQACKLYTNTKYTQSFINYNFSLLLQKNNGVISRVMNPFCTIEVDQGENNKGNQKKYQEENNKDIFNRNNNQNIMNNDNKTQQWIDCCLISPIMGICNPKYLLNNTKQKKQNKARMNGVAQKYTIILQSIKKIFVLQQNNSLALVIFDKPIVQLGWIGLTYFQSIKQLTTSQSQSSFKSISHTSRQLKKTNKGAIYNYQQEIMKVNYKFREDKESNIIRGDGKGKDGSLVVMVMKKKPYLVGMQVSEGQCVVINKEIYQQIKFIAENYVNEDKQKEILQNIDIQGFQIMSKI